MFVRKRGPLPPNSVVNLWAFWPHLTAAVTTGRPSGLSGSAPAPSPARGRRGPCYLTTAALLTHPTGQRAICVVPQRHTRRVRDTGGLAVLSQPQAPADHQAPGASRPRHSLHSPPPPPGSLTQTRPGAELWNGRETVPPLDWLSQLFIIITPPLRAALVIAIRQAVTSPTQARPALTPLCAVCKGNTAVKRATGRSQ